MRINFVGLVQLDTLCLAALPLYSAIVKGLHWGRLTLVYVLRPAATLLGFSPKSELLEVENISNAYKTKRLSFYSSTNYRSKLSDVFGLTYSDDLHLSMSHHSLSGMGRQLTDVKGWG